MAVTTSHRPYQNVIEDGKWYSNVEYKNIFRVGISGIVLNDLKIGSGHIESQPSGRTGTACGSALALFIMQLTTRRHLPPQSCIDTAAVLALTAYVYYTCGLSPFSVCLCDTSKITERVFLSLC
uniref:Uncharacterized protein n=1 Tax=Vespula pensylvanica TaxID=30213 RepID=A0A834PF57_VESPE|nr:hypothetical protein H0235_000925 [Vespula pensylvanica]